MAIEVIEYRKIFANALRDMIDENTHNKGFNKNRLCKAVAISRKSLDKLLQEKKPFIGIDQLYQLMEHGLEINSTQIFMNRLIREGTFSKFHLMGKNK